MAKTIGGLSIKAVCDMLDISRQSLYRYRQDSHWPGDDAPLDYIKAFVAANNINRAGRKKKSPVGDSGGKAPAANVARPPVAADGDDELDAEYNNLQQLLDLDDELKRTVIEKNKAQVAKYQAQCLQVYRDKLHSRLGKAFTTLLDELREMDLSRGQLANIRGALERAMAALFNRPVDPDAAQPEFDFRADTRPARTEVDNEG